MPKTFIEPKTILVAEDDESAQLLYHDVLENEGYKVITVSNGLEVLFNLEHEKVDLIITDSSMPFMTVFQLISEVRKNFPTLPIVVISGHNNENDYVESKCNIQAFFKKPAQIQIVKNTIRQLLEQK